MSPAFRSHPLGVDANEVDGVASPSAPLSLPPVALRLARGVVQLPVLVEALARSPCTKTPTSSAPWVRSAPDLLASKAARDGRCVWGQGHAGSGGGPGHRRARGRENRWVVDDARAMWGGAHANPAGDVCLDLNALGPIWKKVRPWAEKSGESLRRVRRSRANAVASVGASACRGKLRVDATADARRYRRVPSPRGRASTENAMGSYEDPGLAACVRSARPLRPRCAGLLRGVRTRSKSLFDLSFAMRCRASIASSARFTVPRLARTRVDSGWPLDASDGPPRTRRSCARSGRRRRPLLVLPSGPTSRFFLLSQQTAPREIPVPN